MRSFPPCLFVPFNYTDLIVHFTVICLVAKPLNRSEARVDFVMIQTLLLFICNHSFIMLTSFLSLTF